MIFQAGNMIHKKVYLFLLEFKFFVFFCNLILERYDLVPLREIIVLYQIDGASNCTNKISISI